jgi:hypothetical protein
MTNPADNTDAMAAGREATRRRINGTLAHLAAGLSARGILDRTFRIGGVGVGESYRQLRSTAHQHPMVLLAAAAGVLSVGLVARRAARSVAAFANGKPLWVGVTGMAIGLILDRALAVDHTQRDRC